MRHSLHPVLLESELENCSARLRPFDAPKRDEANPAWAKKGHILGGTLELSLGLSYAQLSYVSLSF